jgi:hypothetical protein
MAIRDIFIELLRDFSLCAGFFCVKVELQRSFDGGAANVTDITAMCTRCSGGNKNAPVSRGVLLRNNATESGSA